MPWAEQGLVNLRWVLERHLRLELDLLIVRRIREERAASTAPLFAREEVAVDLMALFVDSRLVGGLRNNFQGRTICQAVNIEIAIQGEQPPHTQMLGGGDDRRIG